MTTTEIRQKQAIERNTSDKISEKMEKRKAETDMDKRHDRNSKNKRKTMEEVKTMTADQKGRKKCIKESEPPNIRHP